MKKYKVKIKDTIFKVTVLSEEEEMRKGLSGKNALAKKAGVLFDMIGKAGVNMTMEGMLFPLDFIFISEKLKVMDVVTLEIGGGDVSAEDVMYVIEVNKNEGEGLKNEKVFLSSDLAKKLDYSITADENLKSYKRKESNKKLEKEFIKKEDDDVAVEEPKKEQKDVNVIINISTNSKLKKFRSGGVLNIYEQDVKIDSDKMQVVDDTGKVLLNLEGGERIFSIEHTEELIRLAKEVESGDLDPGVLGRRMKEIIDLQNVQKHEYTD